MLPKPIKTSFDAIDFDNNNKYLGKNEDKISERTIEDSGSEAAYSPFKQEKSKSRLSRQESQQSLKISQKDQRK